MLNLIAVFLVCSGIGIAVHIAIDLTHRPQSMKIMNAVWILSALWGSYLALWAYNKFGRSSPMKMEDDGMKGMGMSDMKDMDMSGMKDMNMPDMKGMDMGMSMGEMRRPYWQSVALSALHCGAGCTLADIIGEWFTNYVPVTVAGSQLVGNWVLDFVLALIIGVYFQFYAIREMEKISVGNALTRAFKADFFSLLSWQVGMYGWMAIVYFVLFINELLPKDTWIFWFMMQLAMLFGFFCAYPMNALLIKLGIKKGM
ncbi:MAG: DUF4396 domain-containing protein [Bacteroides sp.]|uniref:DUF4396 domain-containing protein n=1 Tax=Bacteroides sp. TaxID=29523 RepID=UPI0031FC69A2|nr:DUF4396 domain-containing protein [Bacteroides sp.]